MWQERAACKGLNTDLFFPVNRDDAAVPLKVCLGCPVRFECFGEAKRNGERYGIWGGVVFGF